MEQGDLFALAAPQTAQDDLPLMLICEECPQQYWSPCSGDMGKHLGALTFMCFYVPIACYESYTTQMRQRALKLREDRRIAYESYQQLHQGESGGTGMGGISARAQFQRRKARAAI